MKPKPIVLRVQAEQDIKEAVEYDMGEGAEQTGFAFIDALEQAFTQIGHYPAIGSPRYAHELNPPGLRPWSVRHSLTWCFTRTGRTRRCLARTACSTRYSELDGNSRVVSHQPTRCGK